MKNLIKLVLLVIILASTSYFLGMNVAKADTIKVAVIDTGFNLKDNWSYNKNYPNPKLCKSGHIDFTSTKNNPNYISDIHGHGTHIAGLIAKHAVDNYCLLIIKYYDAQSSIDNNFKFSLKSFEYAISQNVDIINYSGGGTVRSEKECQIMKKALDKGIIIVAAAGNESSNLDNKGYYPAMCDSRIVMVANTDTKNRIIASTSNLNKEVVSVDGTNVYSLLPNGKYGYMTGTSQATAIETGKIIRLLTLRNIKGSK